MPQQQHLAAKRTTSVRREGAKTVVRYFSTPVVTFDGDSVTLRDGGYLTATTKTKMNQASSQFALGYHVAQRAGNWFVDLPSGQTVRYRDGMTFEY